MSLNFNRRRKIFPKIRRKVSQSVRDASFRSSDGLSFLFDFTSKEKEEKRKKERERKKKRKERKKRKARKKTRENEEEKKPCSGDYSLKHFISCRV